MKKTIYLIGFFVIFLISNGLLFKLLYWKGANMMLLTGVVLLNFVFLPVYFYSRYRKSLPVQ